MVVDRKYKLDAGCRRPALQRRRLYKSPCASPAGEKQGHCNYLKTGKRQHTKLLCQCFVSAYFLHYRYRKEASARVGIGLSRFFRFTILCLQSTWFFVAKSWKNLVFGVFTFLRDHNLDVYAAELLPATARRPFLLSGGGAPWSFDRWRPSGL